MTHNLYAAFNARDLTALLPLLHPDVEWPNGWEGGYLHGPGQVRDYWLRQWAAIDPRVTPTLIEPLPDGRVRVTVHQVVRDLGGALLSDTVVIHLYLLEGGLIKRMEIS
jgi:ketosteroid isomerase-like protein